MGAVNYGEFSVWTWVLSFKHEYMATVCVGNDFIEEVLFKMDLEDWML